jgi:ribosomal protein L27
LEPQVQLTTHIKPGTFGTLRPSEYAARLRAPYRKGRYRQLKVAPGTEVRERDIVATQKGLRYHPGLNAGIDPRDNSIYALTNGTLVVTTEKFNPDFNNDLVIKYYNEFKDFKGNLLKRYIHIIPKETPQTFKLIGLV